MKHVIAHGTHASPAIPSRWLGCCRRCRARDRSGNDSTPSPTRSLGHDCGKSTLNSYLGYAKDVFLLFEAPILSPIYPRKVYGVDHGLLQAIRFSVTISLLAKTAVLPTSSRFV